MPALGDTLDYFPFDTSDDFLELAKQAADKLYEPLELRAQFHKGSALIAYEMWRREIERWQREMPSKNGKPRSPSHLKKAGALACVLNRTQPILTLIPKLSYGFSDAENPTTKLGKRRINALLYKNEWFAIQYAISYIMAAEENRDKIEPISSFLDHLNLSSEEYFSEIFVGDMCWYLKSRSPSPTSLYMVFRANFHSSYLWREKRHQKTSSG